MKVYHINRIYIKYHAFIQRYTCILLNRLHDILIAVWKLIIYIYEVYSHHTSFLSLSLRLPWSPWGRGHLANFLRSVIFPIFHQCQNTL